MRDRFDVAIIGSSLAGASLALRLGRAGITVALIDKQEFPRRKACGEGLSALALGCLERLGLAARALALPHQPLYGFRIWDVSGAGRPLAPLEIAWPGTGPPKAIGISRTLLDGMLAEECSGLPSLCRFHATRAIALERDGEAELVRCSGGRAIRARFSVAACGASSPLLQRLAPRPRGWHGARYGASLIAAIRCGQPDRRVSIFSSLGGEIYCTPIGGRSLNVSLLGRRDAISDALRPARLGALLGLVEDRLGLQLDPPGAILGSGPFGWPARPAWIGQTVLAGDALECLDPIGGMGMSHALLGAELAADTLIAILRDGLAPRRGLELYAARRADLGERLRSFTNLSHACVRSSRSPLLRIFNGRPCAGRLADLALYGQGGTALERAAVAAGRAIFG